MLTAVGASIFIALGLVLAALPMVLITIVLATKRPPQVSWAFLGGWVTGLAVIGTVVITVVDVAESADTSPAWVPYLKIALGVLLLGLAVRKWIGRPRTGEVVVAPKWMTAMESVSAGKALGFGFALAAANPKNLVIVTSGATVIADATPVPWEQAIAFAVFTVIASLGVAAPAIVRRTLGERAGPVLAAADTWMTRQSSTIMSAVLLVLGVVLIINGITAA
ncbi:hypothetical protein D1871_22245 [Nakamurella silvestris]|nr:hypothetical protein D1871_22245 [Nakamurella silvestris]